jgi:hypothetical protein
LRGRAEGGVQHNGTSGRSSSLSEGTGHETEKIRRRKYKTVSHHICQYRKKRIDSSRSIESAHTWQRPSGAD